MSSVSGGDLYEMDADVLFNQDDLLGYEALDAVAPVDTEVIKAALAEYEASSSFLPDACRVYFEGILKNQLLPCDYVVYPGEAYEVELEDGSFEEFQEYCMAYGDLAEENQYFTGEECTIVKWRLNGEKAVYIEQNQEISIGVPFEHGFSNLGHYSGLYAYDWTGLCILVCLVIAGLVWLFRKIMRLNY